VKIELIGELLDQPDGSAIAELDVDEEGKMYLMQLGFELLIRRGLDVAKREKENGITK
tara:strand:+ start:845 stop:1018 length:174 start_codon:yes stop_codon:yes gene_type:complete